MSNKAFQSNNSVEEAILAVLFTEPSTDYNGAYGVGLGSFLQSLKLEDGVENDINNKVTTGLSSLKATGQLSAFEVSTIVGFSSVEITIIFDGSEMTVKRRV